MKLAAVAVLFIASSVHAEGVIAVGGMAGAAPKSAIGGGAIEIGVPLVDGWQAHALAAGGGAEELTILGSSETSGNFTQLRAGLGYRFSRKPGRAVELGVDVGRQQIDWNGTETSFLFNHVSDVSYHHVDLIAVPRVVGAIGSTDQSLELRFGIEAALAQAEWAAFDFTVGVGYRI